MAEEHLGFQCPTNYGIYKDFMKGCGGQLFKEGNFSAALEKKQVCEQWSRAGLELTILQNCMSPSASELECWIHRYMTLWLSLSLFK